MEELGLTLGAVVVFGEALLLGLSIFLPCWLLAGMGKAYKRWEQG